MSKDTWAGKRTIPHTLIRWGYTNCNPMIYSDPSGNIPTPSDVDEGAQVYSCNCGWIDFGHSNSTIAMRIINAINKEQNQFSFDSSDYGNNTFSIEVTASVAGLGDYSRKYIIRSGLNPVVKESVAYGIYRTFMEDIEIEQGKIGLWFTFYSFEDLTSDDIGFYLAKKYNSEVNPKGTGGKNLEAWNWLANVCGFSQDRTKAIQNSLNAYKVFGRAQDKYSAFIYLLVNTPHEFNWDSPLLCGIDGLCTNGESQQWPSEFSTLTPEKFGQNWWEFITPSDIPVVILPS